MNTLKARIWMTIPPMLAFNPDGSYMIEAHPA